MTEATTSMAAKLSEKSSVMSSTSAEERLKGPDSLRVWAVGPKVQRGANETMRLLRRDRTAETTGDDTAHAAAADRAADPEAERRKVSDS